MKHPTHNQESWEFADPVALFVARRLRPNVGWPLGLLALLAAICPALSASQSALRLPLGLFFWAGLLGCIFGMRAGRLRTGAQIRPWHTPLRRLWWLVFVGLGGALLLAASANDALPPLALVLQDAALLTRWITLALGSPGELLPRPPSRALAFLASSLPRAASDLLAAPAAATDGARLLVATGGVALTWLGALIFGWAVASRRSLLGWSLLLVVALLLVTVLGGGAGLALVIGLGVLLLLAVVGELQRREQQWTTEGVAFSDQLMFDVVAWGGLGIGSVLLVALLLPTSLDTLLARWLWADVEVPSGIAVLEQQARGRPTPQATDVGLSDLPALELGRSLQQGDPAQLALRVQLDGPLPPSVEPYYWRSRLLNFYISGGWTTDARVQPREAVRLEQNLLPGTIRQQVEDARDGRRLLVALPDVVATDRPTQAEYLSDGTLAASTLPDQSGYTVVSRPPDPAPSSGPDTEPPDMGTFLQLPQGVPPRVRELARVVAGEGTPAQQALAIETYLRELPYDYTVEPLPPNGDAVDQFLFAMRSGYCTYYASAMAVMARSQGIPARMAVGYSTGEFDEATNSFAVYERDAHAWPELYIDGRWTIFEPTPIRPLPARATNVPPPSVPSVAPEPTRVWPRAAVVVGGVVVALALAALALGVWLRWRPRAVSSVTRTQLQLQAAGERLGVPWPPGGTLHEYSALLEARLADARPEVRALAALVAKARYSRQPLSAEEQQRLRDYGERLGAACRRLPRHKGRAP